MDIKNLIYIIIINIEYNNNLIIIYVSSRLLSIKYKKKYYIYTKISLKK